VFSYNLVQCQLIYNIPWVSGEAFGVSMMSLEGQPFEAKAIVVNASFLRVVST